MRSREHEKVYTSRFVQVLKTICTTGSRRSPVGVMLPLTVFGKTVVVVMRTSGGLWCCQPVDHLITGELRGALPRPVSNWVSRMESGGKLTEDS